MAEDLTRLSAVELMALFRRRAASPVEATRAVLARIERLNPRLNAIIALDAAGAMAQAQASEVRWRAGQPLGPLDGVPLTVKDNICVAGLPCRWGSPLFRDHVPPADELPVARLRAGGAVILGKTNVPELTLQGYTDNTLHGPTRNPWDPALTPGGSSGGAVAAVAAGLGPLALGTDGGGSIRRPASHAGLVGVKPSLGRVPRADGLPAILGDFEVIGSIARTVADATALLAAIAVPALDPAEPRPCRILFVPRFGQNPVDPEIAASVAAAARDLQALGHVVEPGEAHFDVDAVAETFGVIGQSGLAWLMQRFPGQAPAAPALQDMAASGKALGAAALFAALDAVAAFRRAMADLFERWDAIMTPAAAALPWPATETHPPMIAGEPAGPRGHAVFTAFANVAGLPGIALPSAPAASGLPIGFQLVGPARSDAALCALAATYEAAHPWAQRWPAMAEA